MCGITGWVDFERDLTAERETVAAMTDTLAARGPDDEGLLLDRHVALGHRRLAVIDIEGGRQPMTVTENGRLLAALTFSGEIYNYRELRAELAGRGHVFRTASDTEVVLQAYLCWGEGFVDRLNGMFAFGLWDARREELLLVRDRMGVKPLYYRPMPHGVLFGSEPKAILAHPEVSAEVGLDGMREILTRINSPEHAIYRGMRSVRPGGLLRVRRSGIVARRYWRLEAREHTDDLDTTVHTVRELLEDITARQLIADVPLCSLLSGGLDSSAVTALAASALRARDAGPVRSFAVDFPGHTENFQPDEMRGTPDAPYVHELAEYVAAAHSDIVLSSSDLADPGHRAAVLRALDLPIGARDVFASLYLLFRAVRAHSTVALSGESADEVFGGYSWFHSQSIVDTPTFPWIAAGMAMSAGAGRPTPFAPDLADRLDLRSYVRDAYHDALADVPVLAGESTRERRMREVCHLHLTRFVQILLDRKDRMSMANGLEVRVPFCDHRLVEYVFNTPWSMKTFDGREKSLLRAATSDLLPASISARRKSPYPSTQDPGYEASLRHALADLLRRPDAPVRPLLDPGILRDPDTAPRRTAETVLQFNNWLERYQPALDLAA